MKPPLGCLVALALGATALLPRTANADGSQQWPPPVVEKTTSQATGPSMAMVGSGIGIFALSYAPAVVVAASSGLPADRDLYVPIAGPWVDFAQRPGCLPGTSCVGENTDRALLVVDGIFQGLGAVTVVGGFLNTAHETKTVRTIALVPKLRLAPARIGYRGYGLMASGSF